VADGTIDLICSDHAPVDDDGKLVPFGEAEPGATGLELLLPLTLKWAAEEKVTLPTALAKITCEPAKLLGVAAGDLRVGSSADICLFDPAQHWTVERKALKSQGKNTPFLGMELPGKVRVTLVGGHVVHDA
jgi:dihydroorotase